MGSLPKIAWIIGGVVIVGIIVIIIMNSMSDGAYLTTLWNWVFETALELDNPPPSPFN